MKLFGAALLSVWALTAQADPVDDLLETLGSDALIDVLREEFLDYGHMVGEAMLPDAGGAAWRDILKRLYDPSMMHLRVRSAMEGSFAGVNISELLKFYQSERGQRIVEAELAGRKYLLLEGAQETAEAACLEPAERAEALLEFAQVNDLLERNVAGTLNSDLAFYRGLIEGGVFEMQEGDVLAEVQARMPEIRVSLEAWISAYLCAALGDLPEADLAAYIAFSKTDEGAALNSAIFEGYGALSEDLSYAIGLAVSVQMFGEDL